MKIAINTRLLLKNKLEGIGWFTYETLKRITTQHREHEFIFIFDRPYHKNFIFSDNITPVVIGPPSRHPLLWYLWFEYSIPRVLKKHKPDIFISPDNYLSLRTKISSLIVIHDINFYHFPNNVPWFARKYYNLFTPKYASKAKRIATVSEFSKQDIVSTYKIPEEKIDVLYNGVNTTYSPIDESLKTETKLQLSEGCDYFIFIGALNPRKNIHRLFEAYDKFRKEHNIDIKLVIVGEKMFWAKEAKSAYNKMEYKDAVIFADHLNPQQLKTILASAIALTMVSTYEGFGIPLLEAMKCEVPIIAANSTALPEVAGEAALFVDPYSIDEIKNAMIKMATDSQLRTNLVEKGKIQSQKFSWDQTAKRFWESIISTELEARSTKTKPQG